MSTPEPVSVPSSNVKPTEAVVYQGPAPSVMLWPVGAVESALSVIVSLAVRPAPFVATIVCAPGSAAPALHE